MKTEFIYTTEPYHHQQEGLEKMFGREAFALFCEMGTGKSKMIVDEIVNLIEMKEINCAIVLAPNGVHANWKEQFEIHAANNNKIFIQVYKAQPTPAHRERQENVTRQIIQSGRVLILLVNIESLSYDYGTNYLLRVLRARRATYLVVDESHKIKTPGARRTKMVTKLGALAKYRRIATGTEAEEGIHNLFAQFRFLDWNIIGFKFYTPFKNMYCNMGGFEQREILSYKNQSLLAAKIAPYVYQKRKAECLDLPEKIYTVHHIDLTQEQNTLYEQLKEELLTEVDGSIIDTTQVLARMTKLQQVLCGHIHYEDKVKELDSNRARYVAELIEGAHKSIVFCRFIMDVELVVKQLAKLGIASIAITGDTKNRLDQIHSWREDPEIRALVMTTDTGGTGLTLVESSNIIFYSNSFSATNRKQAEDRIHRIGQTKNCTYHDIVVKGKLDSMILKALRDKRNLADEFRGDLRKLLEGESNEDVTVS